MSKKSLMSTPLLARIIGGCIFFVCSALHAQELIVGVTTGVTGSIATSVKEQLDGVKLVFDQTNAQGGIKGRRLRLEVLDDGFDPKRAGENAKILIEQKKADVLFLSRGTPHTQAILPLLTSHAIALVAPSTGAILLHKPVNPYVFNVRSTYQSESMAIVRHFSTIGIKKVAVIHVDDSFGLDALAGVIKGFERINSKPISVLKFDRAKPQLTSLYPQIKQLAPDAVLMVGSSATIIELTKGIHQSGYRGILATLSNNASNSFIQQVGAAGVGMVVSQVFPDERNGSTELVRSATKLAKDAAIHELSPGMVEGFTAAKVLVESLKRAKTLTRSGIVDSLNALNNFDLGGYTISYSPTNHTGMEFVDISVISRDGRFRR